MYNLSIVMPAIRVENWVPVYDSLLRACTKYSFELIIVSPHNLPDELGNSNNITCISKCYMAPTPAFQFGTTIATGKFLLLHLDDGIYRGNAIDVSLNIFKSLNYKDVITMRYSEGGDSQPIDYWRAHHHGNLRLNGIPKHYMIAPLPLMNLEYFRYLGGYDSQWLYLSMAGHDLAIRAQNDGGKIYVSPTEAFASSWEEGRSGTHAPVNDQQLFYDEPLFKKLYSQPNNRIRIPYDNWRRAPVVWDKRFYKDEFGKIIRKV